ncbi:hypothetical protein Tco_1169762 [Tanacetum coccineum]
MKASSMESRGLSNGKKVLKEPSMALPLNDEIIVRELSSLVISPSPKVANGTSGKEVVKSNDRSELLEDLQKVFPPTVMILERRFCGRDKIPSHTIQRNAKMVGVPVWERDGKGNAGETRRKRFQISETFRLEFRLEFPSRFLVFWVLSIMASQQTQQQTQGSSDTDRDQPPLWEHMTKLQKIGASEGAWKFSFKFCGETRQGSYSRVKAHLLGIKGNAQSGMGS